jgi:hypothetical protein
MSRAMILRMLPVMVGGLCSAPHDEDAAAQHHNPMFDRATHDAQGLATPFRDVHHIGGVDPAVIAPAQVQLGEWAVLAPVRYADSRVGREWSLAAVLGSASLRSRRSAISGSRSWIGAV